MLLEFKAKNYKSFSDELVFSMIPAPKQKGLDYSILHSQVGKKEFKGVSTAVVYGPNASGKTNIVGAMDTLRQIVLRGNIDNTFNRSRNYAAFSLELIPNYATDSEPVSFQIKFTDNELMYDYFLSIDIGSFMDIEHPRRIIEEQLLINEKLVYQRGESLVVSTSYVIKDYLNKSVRRNTPKLQEYALNSLSDSELFLVNGFKNLYSVELSKRIVDWFQKRLLVFYRSEDWKISTRDYESVEEIRSLENVINDVAKEFGNTSSELRYKKNESDGEDPVLCSVVRDKYIPADVFESYGTMRFVNEFPMVLIALSRGGTLVVDEFDASLHPMALMNIINIFHNDEININNAQLIFNTHNPIFLKSSLLRRDEIKFVEKDDKSGKSILYSLSDFKTANGIRRGEDYMNNYFVSRYGAIRDVDFSDIAEKYVNQNEEEL